MKKPLILLHGAIGSARQFEPLRPLLSEEFEVHALSLPGHGGSDIPIEPFSIPLFAESVLQFIDQLQIEKISIFGYSMGGYVALYLAVHYPERVEKVFTLGTKLNWTSEFAGEQTVLLNAQKIQEKVPAFAKALEQEHSPQDWKRVLQKTSEMLLNLGEQPALAAKDFSSIKMPVTISVGELDKMVTAEESMNAVKQLPYGKSLLFEATPHPIEKVNHKDLAEHIHRFMME